MEDKVMQHFMLDVCVEPRWSEGATELEEVQFRMKQSRAFCLIPSTDLLGSASHHLDGFILQWLWRGAASELAPV